VDRRAPLLLLLALVACTGVSIALGGARPASDPGVAPWAMQVIGYLCGIAGGVLLLAPQRGDGTSVRDRRIGVVVLPAVVVLALLDAAGLAADEGGANIGAGLVRLVVLLVVVGVTARLALDVAATRRSR
jgi:hypothetical protein